MKWIISEMSGIHKIGNCTLKNMYCVIEHKILNDNLLVGLSNINLISI